MRFQLLYHSLFRAPAADVQVLGVCVQVSCLSQQRLESPISRIQYPRYFYTSLRRLVM